MQTKEFVEFIQPHVNAIYGMYLTRTSPLLSIFMANGTGIATDSTTHKWSDLQLAPKSWTTNAIVASNDLNGGTKTGVLKFGTAPAGLVVGSILQGRVAGKRSAMQVKVQSISGGDVTVKVYADCPYDAAVVGSGITFELFSTPIKENNKSFDTKSSKLPTKRHNNTQIIEESFELSDTLLNSNVDTLIADDGTLTQKAVNEISFSMDQAFYSANMQLINQMYYGRRVERDPALGENGSFAGLDFYIDNIVIDLNNTTLDEVDLMDVIAAIRAQGGLADIVVAPTRLARRVSSFQSSNQNIIVVNGTDGSTIGNAVDKIKSDIPGAGLLRVIVDDSIADDEMFVLSSDKVALVPYANRAMRVLDGTVNGQDGSTLILRGEYTLEVRGGQYTHAKFKRVG